MHEMRLLLAMFTLSVSLSLCKSVYHAGHSVQPLLNDFGLLLIFS